MKGFAAHWIVGVLFTSLSLTLVACSASKSPEVTQYERQKIILSDRSSSPQSRMSQLSSLARVAIEKEDWQTAGQAYIQLCHFETSSNLAIKESSCEHLQTLLPLIEDQSLLFNGKLAYYFFSSSKLQLAQLEQLATNDEQHARLALAQGKIPTHIDRKSLLLHDQAQWLYLQGKSQSSRDALHNSAKLFGELGYKQKAADSRFLLAQLLWKEGLHNQARREAAQSYFLLEQLKNSVAQKAVKDWLDARKTTL